MCLDAQVQKRKIFNLGCDYQNLVALTSLLQEIMFNLSIGGLWVGLRLGASPKSAKGPRSMEPPSHVETVPGARRTVQEIDVTPFQPHTPRSRSPVS